MSGQPGDTGDTGYTGDTGDTGEMDPAAVAAAGRPTRLTPSVVRVTAPNPGMMTGPGTNTYLVGGDDELVALDPGPDDEGHLDLVAQVGAGRIRHIVVTHTHPDHAPGASGLAARTGAEVVGFDARDGFTPDRRATDGFTLAVDGRRLQALHTPGHASNHLCWLLVEEGIVFSGDHVMQGSTVVIAPPDGDMATYLASLRRLRELEPPARAIAPGHGSLLDDPASVVDGIIAHRLEREAKVADALGAAGRASVDDLLPRVYADVDEALYPVARCSLWAHLRKLGDEGRAFPDDRDDIAAAWGAKG
ncbi:MAG TPA: MBL fold metallo-hydrolase [Acidimicrobiales bacterium]|nr:MBL fold metallo-hydrolase [Acidimicrobiales bacterium]